VRQLLCASLVCLASLVSSATTQAAQTNTQKQLEVEETTSELPSKTYSYLKQNKTRKLASDYNEKWGIPDEYEHIEKEEHKEKKEHKKKKAAQEEEETYQEG
jgi:hypothetical protein